MESANITACRAADLTASGTGSGDFLRTYDWSIDKSLPEGQPDQVISDGEGNASVDYSVLVDVVDHTDSGWNVTGSVTVGNPNDYMSVEASVEVDLGLEGAGCTVDETADVDAETAGVQVSLEAAGGATLGFDCTLTSLGGEPVVATATIVWDGGELAVTSEPIEFEFRTYNGYVAVYDDHGNPDDATLLELISVDDAPAAYDYTIEFTGLSAACEIVTNTAWVELVVAERATGAAAGVSADEGVLASDQVDVTICPPRRKRS